MSKQISNCKYPYWQFDHPKPKYIDPHPTLQYYLYMHYLMSETNLYIISLYNVVKGGSPTKGDKSKIVWEVVEQQFEALVSVLLNIVVW